MQTANGTRTLHTTAASAADPILQLAPRAISPTLAPLPPRALQEALVAVECSCRSTLCSHRPSTSGGMLHRPMTRPPARPIYLVILPRWLCHLLRPPACPRPSRSAPQAGTARRRDGCYLPSRHCSLPPQAQSRPPAPARTTPPSMIP